MSTTIDDVIIADGESNYRLGVNSLDDPAKLPAGQIAWAFNAVSKGNNWHTRPPYRSMLRLSSGRAQGLALFIPAADVPYLVFAVSGIIYTSAYPFIEYSKLQNVQFDPYVDHIVFKEAVVSADLTQIIDPPYAVMMMQDGRGRAAFWDGSTARHLNPTAVDGAGNPANETPIGLWMEWVGNRLWVASDRLLTASNIGDPLHFTETIYLSGGGAFQAPDGAVIMGLKRTADNSQLLVGTFGNMSRVAAGITDRGQWPAIQNFVSYLFPGVGLVGGKAIWDHNGDIMWMSPEGARIYSAVGSAVLNVRRPISSLEMERSFRNMSPCMRRCAGASFGPYSLCSVPSGDIRNRHTWVLDTRSEERESNVFVTSAPLAWQGVWTGTFPVEWAAGDINGVKRIFFISNDNDAPRIWEAFVDTLDGDNGVAIQSFIETARHVGVDGNGKVPGDRKRFRYSEIYLDHLKGKTALSVDYRSEFSCWVNILEAAFCAKTCRDEWNCAPWSENQAQARYLRTNTPRAEKNPNGSPFNENEAMSFQLRMSWLGQLGVRQHRIVMDKVPMPSTGQARKPDDGCFESACCQPEPDYISFVNDASYYYGINNQQVGAL